VFGLQSVHQLQLLRQLQSLCQLWYVRELQPVLRLQFVCELRSECWLQRVWRQLRHDQLCRAGPGLCVVRRARGRRACDARASGCTGADGCSGTRAYGACERSARDPGPHACRTGFAGSRAARCLAPSRPAAVNFREIAKAGRRAGVGTDSASRHAIELHAGAAVVRSARSDRGAAELCVARDSPGGLARCTASARQRRLGAGAKLTPL